MTKDEYLKELLNNLELSRKNLVGFILKKDGYIDGSNDLLVRKLDKFIENFKYFIN